MNSARIAVIASFLCAAMCGHGMDMNNETPQKRFKAPKRAKVMLDVSVDNYSEATVFFVDRKITVPIGKNHHVRTVAVGTITVHHDGRCVLLPNMSGDYKKSFEELCSVRERLPAIIERDNIDCRYAPVAQ